MEKEIFINFYDSRKIAELGKEKLTKLAKCYQEVFNYYWHENWTFKQALAEVERSLKATEHRRPLLSLLLKGNEICGFAWIILTTTEHITTEDMPFNLEKKEKELGLKETRFWFERNTGKKIVIFREVGVRKEFQMIRGAQVAPKMTLPIVKKAKDENYHALFYWTNPNNIVFRYGVGFGWKPIYNFANKERTILAGSVPKLVYYIEGLINKKRDVFLEMAKNRRKYLAG